MVSSTLDFTWTTKIHFCCRCMGSGLHLRRAFHEKTFVFRKWVLNRADLQNIRDDGHSIP